MVLVLIVVATAALLWFLRGGDAANPGVQDASVDADNSGNAWWMDYPEAPKSGSWPTEELDEERYVAVVTEVACLNRDFQGVDEQKTELLSRIYFHHRTTGKRLAAYGATINRGSAEEAQRIGERLALQVERCGSKGLTAP
jgi:hypothetical protein